MRSSTFYRVTGEVLRQYFVIFKQKLYDKKENNKNYFKTQE